MDYEARAAEQVPLLMKMKRDELALTKAIESGDTDLGMATFIIKVKDNRKYRQHTHDDNDCKSGLKLSVCQPCKHIFSS